MALLMPLPLTVSRFSKIQIGFTFLVPGSPGKRAVKRVCVCVVTVMAVTLTFFTDLSLTPVMEGFVILQKNPDYDG